MLLTLPHIWPHLDITSNPTQNPRRTDELGSKDGVFVGIVAVVAPSPPWLRLPQEQRYHHPRRRSCQRTLPIQTSEAMTLTRQ